jgi:hypothetical protein
MKTVQNGAFAVYECLIVKFFELNNVCYRDSHLFSSDLPQKGAADFTPAGAPSPLQHLERFERFWSFGGVRTSHGAGPRPRFAAHQPVCAAGARRPNIPMRSGRMQVA